MRTLQRTFFVIIVLAAILSVPTERFSQFFNPDILLAQVSGGSVTVDSVGPSSAGTACPNCSTLSWNHTVSGSNTLLTVGVAVGKITTNISGYTISATYAGVPLTSAGRVVTSTGSTGIVQFFYLKAPASGTNTVQVTLTGGTADIEAGSVSFTGVDQTTPVRNITTNNGNGTTASVTVPSATGNMVVTALSTGDRVNSSGNTAQWIKNQNNISAAGNGAQSTAPGTSSVNMTYAVNSDYWGIIGMDVVTGGASTPTFPTISSFTSSPSSISQGNSSTLSWSVSGNPPPTLSIDNGVGSVSGTSISVSPSVNTTYTLTATNSQGNTTAQTTVTVTAPPPPDTTSPSVPFGLSATAISSSQINLSWTASADNVAVTGYKIYRGGVQIGTSVTNNYSDLGLSASTNYSYTVSAYDAAGNNSAQSSSANATTQAQQSGGGGSGPWSGILSSSRAIDWSKAGLPATLPGGETTPNPWTPPTRTQCVTSQCNTLSGGTVTVASINAAITSAPAGTYVLIPAGNFSLSGTINLKSNVTLRGSGAQATKISGASISTGNSGGGYWAGGSLLSGSITKGATSVTIANGQTVPSSGRTIALSQCMTGFTAPNANYTQYSGSGWVSSCTGTIFDPSGPWICGGYAQCNRNGNRGVTNPHFMGQLFWVPAGGISGNTVTLDSPTLSPLWSTSNSASIMWLSGSVLTGAGMEDFTFTSWLSMNGCYGCWMKGTRIIFSNPAVQLTSFTHKSLIMNNYFAPTGSGFHTIMMGSENDPAEYDSNMLVLNNIFLGGYIQENGGNQGLVFAYNFISETPKDGNSSDFTDAGDFPHNPGGQMFMLREGNQAAISWDDDTWTTHNFNTWFRNWISGYDSVTGGHSPDPVDIGGFSRFDNIIGNVIGSPQMAQAFSIGYADVIGINRNGIEKNGLTAASLMRWGNYLHCTGDATHCQISTGTFDNSEVPTNLSTYGANSTPYQNPVPANHSLPASFFMNITAHPSGGTGLNWWKTCSAWATFPTGCATYTTQPFPPIGPDVTGGSYMSGHAYDIPARIAWNNLPSDPSYSGTNIRQFDQRVYQVDTGGSGGDTTTPSIPSGLSATAVSSSQINLSWTASTDNVGVTGYKIYRGGVQIGTSASTNYSDTNLTASTQYSYTVAAYDAAGNDSSQSSSAISVTVNNTAPVSTKFTAGQRVQTTSNLNVRATASATGTLLGTQPSSALGTIISGGQSADGYYWWNVNYDSGADGYSVEDYLQAYSAPIVGDFNGDGLVNSIDLSLMTSAWNTNNATYDLNRDSIVNSLDYAVMVQNWSL